MNDDGHDSSPHRDTNDQQDARIASPRDILTRNRSLNQKIFNRRRSHGRALALAILGVALFVAGTILRGEKSVLFALGGTGMFSGLLLYFLSTEPLLPAQVCIDANSALTRNERAFVSELELQDIRIYVPDLATPAGERSNVRLFVPELTEYVIPSEVSTETLLVNSRFPNERGVAFYPSGAALFRRFRNISTKKSVASPESLVEGVTEAVTDQFQLARSATGTSDITRGRITIEIGGSRLGLVDRFDHPTTSFIAVAFAEVLQKPIRVNSEQSDSSETQTLSFEFVETKRKPANGRHK